MEEGGGRREVLFNIAHRIGLGTPYLREGGRKGASERERERDGKGEGEREREGGSYTRHP